MSIFEKVIDFKNALIETFDENPETGCKIIWGAGMTAFVVLHQISLWKLHGEVIKLKGMVDAHTIELNLIEGAMDHNTKQFVQYRILNQNNDHACIAMLDFLADKLGVKEEMCAAGKAASDLYLKEMNVDPDKLLSALAEAPARVTSF